MNPIYKNTFDYQHTESLNNNNESYISLSNKDNHTDYLNHQAEDNEDSKLSTITFRSILVGLMTTCIGGAIAQLFVFKPVSLNLHTLVLQVACLVLSRAFSTIPGPIWWNPHPLTLKEIVFSSIMATSGAAATLSVEVIAAQDLIFEKKSSFIFSLILSLSVQLIGLSLAGLFRPFLIYPVKTTFPSIFPSISLFSTISKENQTSRAQVSIFKKTFLGILIYETIPGYIAPALQAISPWCLTLPAVPAVTNLFGGSLVGEGLGLFSVSADWQLIVDWSAMAFGIFLMSAAYRYDWFGGGKLPFISFELLDQVGNVYNFTQTVNPDGTENVEGVQKLGLPSFSTSLIIGLSGILLAASSSITSGLLFHWNELSGVFKQTGDSALEDPNRKLCKSYADVPSYVFAILGVIAAVIAFVCLSRSGLSWVAVTSGLFVAGLLSLAVGIFFGEVGIQLPCNGVFQMIGGCLFPGNAIGTMMFTMLGSTIVTKCTMTLSDLKLGQSMRLSGLSVALAQCFGTLMGGVVHLGTMRSILDRQRDVLLLRNGDGIYTGWMLTSFTAQSTTWGLFSRRLYLPGQKYEILPYCLIAGFVLPIPIFLLHKWKPKAGFNRLNISLFASSIFNCIKGATSGRMTAMVIGFYTQYYIRKYHFGWYQKYNYTISAALDGGTEMAILLLTILFQGGIGITLKMPTYVIVFFFFLYIPHVDKKKYF
ncbi:hypothetical protein CROQUDRAFT_50677 [Cronartium quercuum f. sp. fusiforme G11]|uniref:Oligopeptide transporter n=1 Tax=Cronartium quercuum f. sp. fusiforme G11 TaxID=708437 RepID=A0A9P6T7N9_9BASI|nr:hypothetical protein CROQUDRAFT_50677 [Cronartium quercuum f. sp. fusiforme G11]